MNNKLCVLIAVACLGTSLYGSFPRDIQRDLLGADPVARKAAAQRALKMRLPALKLMTFTGMSAAQLQQIVNAPTAAAPAAQPRVRPAPEAQPRVRPAPEARRVRPEGGLGMRPPVRPVERPEGVRPGLPQVEKPARPEKGELIPAEEGELGRAPAPAEPKGEEPEKAGEAAKKNPLAEFSALKDRGLLDKLTEKQITDAPFYSDVLIENPKITAEDAYRMILGLEPNYTLGDQTKAYRKASLKWHPDKNIGNEEYAAKVFQLVNIANEGLETAAKHKMATGKR